VNGKIYNIGLNDHREAEAEAQSHVASGQKVEVIDGVTGQVVRDLSIA
jgi:hypothetical protein